MGYVFDVEDETFWSPSLNVGRVFLAQVAELEALVGEPSGVIESMSDTVDIEIQQLQKFVDLAIRSQTLENLSLRMMLKGALQHLIAFLIVHQAWQAQTPDSDLVKEAKLLAEKLKLKA